jgi:hypothetical protein
MLPPVPIRSGMKYDRANHLGDLVVKGTEHGAGVDLGRKQQQ